VSFLESLLCDQLNITRTSESLLPPSQPPQQKSRAIEDEPQLKKALLTLQARIAQVKQDEYWKELYRRHLKSFVNISSDDGVVYETLWYTLGSSAQGKVLVIKFLINAQCILDSLQAFCYLRIGLNKLFTNNRKAMISHSGILLLHPAC
jgi:hypothetical protein